MYFNQNDNELSEEMFLPWVNIDPLFKNENSIESGLSYLNSLNKFYVYNNILIFDTLFDSSETTKNCLTVRNRYFQQIYYIGTEGNKRPGTILPFTLRIIDQYNRLIIKIKKYLKPCFSDPTVDIECPPGKLLAKMVRNTSDDEKLFSIYDSKESNLRFIVTKNEYKRSKNEYKIVTEKKESIASICRRYEKVLAVDKTVIYEDHFVKINVEERNETNVFDKAIILSAALIIDIFLMRKS